MQTSASVRLVPEGGQETLSIILLSCRLYELSGAECQPCCNVLFMLHSSVCVRLRVWLCVCVFEEEKDWSWSSVCVCEVSCSPNKCVKSRVSQMATVLRPEWKPPSSYIGVVSGGNNRGIFLSCCIAERLHRLNTAHFGHLKPTKLLVPSLPICMAIVKPTSLFNPKSCIFSKLSSLI